MYNFKKYKCTIFLITENSISLKNFKKIEKTNFFLNYLFSKRLKILRNFIFINSLFLVLMPFNPLVYKSELMFKLKSNFFFLLAIDGDYINFFF